MDSRIDSLTVTREELYELFWSKQYAVRPGGSTQKQVSPARSNNGQRCNWSRKEIGQWLIDLAGKDARFIVGIDHGFSFPQAYFEHYRLTSLESVSGRLRAVLAHASRAHVCRFH
jgi:hypothetical protein